MMSSSTAALLHTATSLPPHFLLGLLFPGGTMAIRAMTRSVGESYDLHKRLYARPGFAAMMRKLEWEDLLTLPAMALATPLDLKRIRRKFIKGVKRLPVEPPDDFPYPDYYLNDFHNQKNGNLSLQAALTYEWQIRVLFLNANRLMRQAVVDHIPPGDELEILDVACGTGVLVPQAFLQGRKHRITAIDLSPCYLRLARMAQRLGMRKGAEFLQMNAENLRPEWTERFDLVTNIWMLHELPRPVVERVIGEMARVLKPGGRLLLLDSLQQTDIPNEHRELAHRIYRFFARYFNEPYFLSYQRLDIPGLLTAHGLHVEKTEVWFRSKLWVARKQPL